jgi:hypothetical protein
VIFVLCYEFALCGESPRQLMTQDIKMMRIPTALAGRPALNSNFRPCPYFSVVPCKFIIPGYVSKSARQTLRFVQNKIKVTPRMSLCGGTHFLDWPFWAYVRITSWRI